jgi:hypothetical protein
VSFNLGQAAAGFNPGSTIGSFGSNASSGAFDIGLNAASGFGQPNSGGGGFLNGLAGRLAGLFNDNGTAGPLGVAGMLGNYGIQAANNYNRGAEVAARNNQISLSDDFLDQYNAAKLKQGLAINPEQRQKNLMGVIPQLANNIAYSTGSPDSGFQSAARVARLLA